MSKPKLPAIEHIVVLMLENRSFDHMLGTVPGVDGVLDGKGKPRKDLVNYTDPSNPKSKAYRPTLGANFFTPLDQETSGGRYGGPSHSYPSASQQRFGSKTDQSGKTAPYYGPVATSSPADQPVGFVSSFIGELEQALGTKGLAAQQAAAKKSGGVDPVQEVMEVFTADQLPAIHTLATEFCTCDRWFSEVPGPTEPNRLFMHAATSTGLTYNPWNQDVLDTPTIYERLEAAGKDWAMYGFDLFDSTNYQSLRDKPQGKLPFEQFLADAAAGKLPFYTFLCPRYADAPAGQANSQHAPHDVRFGDALIAQVYAAVRASPAWPKTLLIITHDEHGGYYDHVLPPAVEAPDASVSPNAFMENEAARYHKTYLTEAEYVFRFDYLGFRVPALLVSPLIPKGSVAHTAYRHTSVLRFIADLIGSAPLTKRDANAASFAAELSLSSPRTDCPQTVPSPALPKTATKALLSQPPSAKQDEWTRRYTTHLQGHPDTGTPTRREFPTRRDLYDYIAERNRHDDWYRAGERGRFEIYRDKDKHWRWRLRDGKDIIAMSSDTYSSEAAAREAFSRLRYLFYTLQHPTIRKS
ncbi:MAG: DUF1508 domain-containing protein [Myxococcales bacterium]|nr:DUF1508 domain-containing protein [Myxococcales bacterium]